MEPDNSGKSEKSNSPILAKVNADVDVVIVSFNSQHIIGKLLASLPNNATAIVVDNASDNRSAIIAREASVRYVRSGDNLGFGKAANLGASLGNGKFILFVNPDSILRPKAFETMLETLRLYPSAAMVGPRLIYPGGGAQWRYSSVIHPIAEQQTQIPIEPTGVCCVPLLTGSALLCRRDAFESVGGFDEKIFLYHEDDDICRRLTERGWSLIYEPSAVVTHASGLSSPHSMKLMRFKAKQRLISLFYVSMKYAIPINISKERRKSYKRLLISILTFHPERFAAALGRLDAIRSLNTETGTKLENAQHTESKRGSDSDATLSNRKLFW